MQANEKFSGRGHVRHLCKDCARLGKEELAYRQTVRNLDRLLTWDGRIPRRKRAQFEKYLNHTNERVRACAPELEMSDAWELAERRLYRDVDYFLGELAAEEGIVPLNVFTMARNPLLQAKLSAASGRAQVSNNPGALD